ncbi:MAG: YidC/Oxa1 family membrane protein insertase [Oscillospiraceae bacterium]|nr:YidC/Oxa1 family membrane protein insertase [Oscillospiraceae bacterium]
MGFISELIGSILGFIMWPVYSLVKNYGIAIAIFTVIMRILLFPLSVKQQKMVAANAAFAPKLESLKKKYANNPTKLQEEQMKLYAEENINPMSSCLPMFLQMFVLFGMIDVVYKPLTHVVRIGKDTMEALKNVAAPLFEGNSSFRSRPELFILQSVKENPSLFTDNGIGADVVQKILDFDNMLFGFIDLGVSPNTVFQEGHVWTAASVGLLMIPLLSGLVQICTTLYNNRKQKKLNPEAAAQMGSMNIIFYVLPIFYVPLYFSLPAGISFYWTCSSLVGIVQMIVLHKIYTPEYVQKLIEKDKLKNKNKKRSGFMEKYNEMLQEQLRQQNEANNTSSRRISTAGVSDDDSDGEIKLSNSQMKEYERKIIAEARRRQAEKYGGVYKEDED